MTRHYLNFSDLTAAEYHAVLADAERLKADVKQGERRALLAHRLLLMIFEQPSTRTRASFVAAMTQAGGTAKEIALANSQQARGESPADSARVLSAYADAVMIRAHKHESLVDFAACASCPVINGLSDLSHPCQALADVMTYRELRGELAGRRVAWIGDCNNVAYSWAEAARLFECDLIVACPPTYQKPLPGATVVESAAAAADGADLVMTDVWASMGQPDVEARAAAFADYQVTPALMQTAAKDALFMHCLPAYRGKEVAAEVIDGDQSVVWQQAENRLHAQKALLIFLISAAETAQGAA